jgi:hypothetical protein
MSWVFSKKNLTQSRKAAKKNKKKALNALRLGGFA